MITFALALLAAPEAMASNGAANWECADPLIQKNYMQVVPAKQLALRIADECSIPYRPGPPLAGGQVPFSNEELFKRHTEHYRKMEYSADYSLFLSIIEERILKARRRDEIPLKR